MYEDGKENKKKNSLRIMQNMFTDLAELQGTVEHSLITTVP